MTLTPHARRRLASRLSDADLALAMDRLYHLPRSEGRRAVVLVRGEQHGKPRGPSNGDMIVAICRDDTVITIMYRRSNQPLTPDALDVDVIDDYARYAPDPNEDQTDECDDCYRSDGTHNPEVEL